jgi:hypothetical protein
MMSALLYIGVVMTYEEKGAWVYLVVSLGVYVGYLVTILRRATGIPVSEVSYVSPMLWSIGISIGLAIVARIIVEILRPSDSYQSDARDKDINRLGDRIGGGVLSLAMLVPFGLTLAEAAYFWIANAIYAAFVLMALVGTTARLIAYRRGF